MICGLIVASLRAKLDQRQVARCLLSHWSKRAPLTRLAAVTSPVGRCGLPLQSCSASGLGTPAPRGCRGSVGPEALESAKKKSAMFRSLSRHAAGATWQLRHATLQSRPTCVWCLAGPLSPVAKPRGAEPLAWRTCQPAAGLARA